MYTISHFGNEYQANGSIQDALNVIGLDVGNNDPYVNGQQANMGATPAPGARVTFRPRSSGKA